MTATGGGPILFLNPAVLLDRLGPTVIGGQPVYGIRNAAPWPNGSADRIAELCRAVGASVVLTDIDRMGDVRRRLDKIGFRVAYHSDWVADALGGGIAAWLAAHGGPTHVVIDQGVDDPGQSLPSRIGVPIGAEVPTAGLARLLAALS